MPRHTALTNPTPTARPAAGQLPGACTPVAAACIRPDRSATPEQILAERFARGEIDEDEYRRRLAVLRGAPPA